MVTPVQDGDQVITLLDITQPQCALVYGEGQCQAVLGETGEHKCFNGRASCQDPENYAPTATVTTRYRKDESIPDIYGRCIPSLRSVSITPGQINIGAMDRNVSPFGRRNVADLTFEDHPSLDIGQDPYFEERISGEAQGDGIGYNPEERGTYWPKWLARNPFHSGYEATLYRGAVGQPVEDMQRFNYVIDQISGPDDNGGVSMTLKDLFSRVTERKAKLPKASRGELANDLPEGETGSFNVKVPGGTDINEEYPASGAFRVTIGSEVIRVTRSGTTFSIQQRADIGTRLDSHDADDTVQLVYSQEGESSGQITRNLLVEGTIVRDEQIPLDDWLEQSGSFRYTAHIVKPTPVEDLIGELSEQAGFTVYPEISTGMIRLRALEPQVGASATLTEIRDVLDDGVDKRRRQDTRVSQVWVYFGLIDPTEDLDDNTNFRTRLIRGDLASESDEQYGNPAIREVYSRWIPQFGRGEAQNVGDRILSLYRDPPLSASFNLAVTRTLPFTLAERFNITLDREQGFTGLAQKLSMVPIQIMRSQDRLMIAAQELRFFTPPDEARNLFIDNDTQNFNLRDAHDGQFGPAVSGDEINCFINAVVGSEGATTISFDTGDWPAGVTINLILSADGVLAGRGGDAGPRNLSDDRGFPGHLALRVRVPVNVDNGGVIGGGGGGGGGAFVLGAIRGGGGAGRIVGEGANNGTLFLGGDGQVISGNARTGDGGDMGQDGDPRTDTNGNPVAGSEGGEAGNAIEGVANVTFIAMGDIRGAQV